MLQTLREICDLFEQSGFVEPPIMPLGAAMGIDPSLGIHSPDPCPYSDVNLVACDCFTLSKDEKKFWFGGLLEAAKRGQWLPHADCTDGEDEGSCRECSNVHQTVVALCRKCKVIEDVLKAALFDAGLEEGRS